MASERARHPPLDRSSPRQILSTARSLKDERCRDCQMLSPPTRPATCREACLHKREFAPTPNRFSVLADLDQSPTKTKWTFDFVHTPGLRRRGKRGGKHNKVQYATQKGQQSRKSQSLGDLCQKITTLCPSDDPLTNSTTTGANHDSGPAVPRSDFTFSTDSSGHHWLPQFRPNSEPVAPAHSLDLRSQEIKPVLQPPERCLAKTELAAPSEAVREVRCKESRFFPVSAFLATPPDAVDRTPKGTRPAPARQERTGEQRSIAPPTPAQRAAASAASKALALRIAESASPILASRPMTTKPSGPSPAAQSDPTPRPTLQDRRPSMTPSSALLPITPPHTASPSLTTSSATSTAPSLTLSPTILPTVPPSDSVKHLPLLPPRPGLSPITPQSWTLSGGTDIFGPTSPVSLITAPITSPHPFIQPLKSSPAVPSATVPVNAKPIIPAVPRCFEKKKDTSCNTGAQKGLADFLKMGHASPCWCSQSPASSCRSSDVPAILSQEPETELRVLRKRKYDESDLASDLDAFSIQSSSTASSSDEDFEDLGFSRQTDLTTRASEEDDEWTMVTPGDGRYIGPTQPSPMTASPTIEAVMISSPESVISYPTPPLTPILTPHSVLFPPSAPPPAAETRPLQRMPKEDVAKPAATLSYHWTTPAQILRGIDRCVNCSGGNCVCHDANASAVEWPTLQEAMRNKRMRRDTSSSRESDDKGIVWDGITDWFNEGDVGY